MKNRTVAITGATGCMGSATVSEILRRNPDWQLKLLVRDTRKNRRLLKNWSSYPNVRTVWGDLTDRNSVESLVKGADVVLHIGGMVSPAADYFPEKTWDVNVNGARNIVEAICKLEQKNTTSLVYIGSVSQYGPHRAPDIWGGAGDKMTAAEFDVYAQSKIAAERIIADSDIKHWVSLRQSGILSLQTLFKGSDPITFHVPLNGVIEWATVEDSARLMAEIAKPDVNPAIWHRFFDISSGRSFRLTNYQFECKLLKAIGCPSPEKCFVPNWFATGNFHGIWYAFSDELERLVPFREGITFDDWLKRMKSFLPWFFKLTPIAPAFIIKVAMKRVASHPVLGTLSWAKDKSSPRWKAFFGDQMPEKDWTKAILPPPNPNDENPILRYAGFDRSKSEAELTLEDMHNIASLQGGDCLETEMKGGSVKMLFRTNEGTVFEAKPNTIAFGGHWGPIQGQPQ